MTHWNRKELTELLAEYDAAADDVSNADHSSFQTKLERFLQLLRTHPYLVYINDNVLPTADFAAWYSRAIKTTEGRNMAGSGKLNWPVDRKECMSMEIGLLEYVAHGKETPSGFCRKFMYAGTSFDDQVTKINQQIIVPFIRDYKQIVTAIGEQAIMEFGDETTVAELSWHQRPLGLTVIGIVVTIIGGLGVLKISGQW